MLQFQPPGFEQRVMETSLGVMAYYSQIPGGLWDPDGTLAQRPPLFFLHSLGGGSSAYEWSQVYGALAADYRVIAPDLVGWGQSAHPARAYVSEDYCVILAELIKQTVGDWAIVAATSLTAGITVRLAIAHPELFRALFLVSPSGNDDFGAGYRFTLPAILAGTPGLDRLIYRLGAANELAVTQFLQNFLFANRDRLRRETIQAYLTGTQQPNADYSALASLRGDICFDLSYFIPRLKVPTTIVVGEQARFNQPCKTQRLAALNPEAIHTLHVVPGVGVLPHVETPAVVVGLLRAFLRTVPS